MVFTFRGCDLRSRTLNMKLHPELNCCTSCDYPIGSCDTDYQRFRLGLARTYGDAFFVTTPDLVEFLSRRLAHAVHPAGLKEGLDDIAPDVKPAGVFRVVTSSNHHGIDGTRFIIAAVDRLREEGHAIELIVVSDREREALAIYKSADVYVGKLRLGYYNNANIETMLLGVPNMSFIRDGCSPHCAGLSDYRDDAGYGLRATEVLHRPSRRVCGPLAPGVPSFSCGAAASPTCWRGVSSSSTTRCCRTAAARLSKPSGVLVIGGAGFIGRHLLRRLASEGVSVTATYRLGTSPPPIEGVSWVGADLAAGGSETGWPAHPETVVHLAQSRAWRKFPEGAADVFRVNVAGVFRAAEYARCAGARRFIYLSSGSVYSDTVAPFMEDQRFAVPSARPFYPAAKLAAEVLLAPYAGPVRDDRAASVRALWRRTECRSMLLPQLIDRVTREEPITLSGSHGFRMNPVAIGDVGEVVQRCLRLDRSVTLNVAGPEVVTLREVGETIGRVLEKPPRFDVRSDAVATDIIGDTTLLRATLGWAPSCRLADGLREWLESASLDAASVVAACSARDGIGVVPRQRGFALPAQLAAVEGIVQSRRARRCAAHVGNGPRRVSHRSDPQATPGSTPTTWLGATAPGGDQADHRFRPTRRGPLSALREMWWVWTVVRRYEIVHSHFMVGISRSGWEWPLLRRMGRHIVVHFRGCEVRDRAQIQQRHPAFNICEECD